MFVDSIRPVYVELRRARNRRVSTGQGQGRSSSVRPLHLPDAMPARFDDDKHGLELLLAVER